MPVIHPSPLDITVHPLADNTTGSGSQFWSGETPSFKDIIDTINPLEHLPVISSIYDYLTGSTPSSGANITGGALYGGPFGLASAIINEIVKGETGKDVGGNMIAALTGEASTQTASNTSSNGAPSPVNKAAYAAYQQSLSWSA